MKKRVVSILLCLTMLLSVASVIALPTFAATSGETGDCTWTFEGSTLTISGSGEMEDFWDNSDQPWYDFSDVIETVIISDGVTNIGDYAFTGCSSLANITIPDSVAEIGYCSFENCIALTGIVIPNNVASISTHTFFNCPLISSVTVPEKVNYIGERAFGYYYDEEWKESKLNGFTIQGYTYSSAEKFALENGFTFVSLGEADVDFSGECGEEVTWSYDKDSKTLTISGDGNMNHYWEDISKQPWYSFSERIETVVLTDGVTNIGGDAFFECSALASVIIPSSVTCIESGAFYKCPALASITIPEGVDSIESSAFTGCSFTEITIPESVRYIERQAFGYYYDEETWNDVKIDGFTVNGYTYSIAQRYASENGFNFVSIGEIDTFGQCGEDAVWSFDKDTKTLTVSGSGDMDDYWNNDQPWYAFSDLIEKVIISDGIINIGADAFCGCCSLTDITIADSVTNIENYAFRDCTALINATIPDSVTDIGWGIFESCTSLTGVVIGDGVARIENDAFYDCPLMTSVTVPKSITYIGEKAFGYYYDEEEWETVKVDGFTVNGYTYSAAQRYAAENEFNFVPLGEIDFYGKCGEDAVWSFDKDTKTLTISGSGDMDDYWNNDQPWYAFSDLIEKVVMTDGVTDIGCGAFSKCRLLTDITIPDSVTWIGSEAFNDCRLLTSITVPASVTYIGEKAFGYYYDEEEWETVKVDGFTVNGYSYSIAQKYALENGFTFVSIGEAETSGECGEDAVWSFDKDTKTLTVSGSGDMDGYWDYDQPWYAFSDLIEKVIISDGITNISSYAFSKCSVLTDVTIGKDVQNIGGNAFSECCSLAGITIPDSVTRIENEAFYNCPLMTSITVPASVTYIGYQAFGYYYDEEEWETVKVDGFTVNGYTYSIAQKYALENGFTFVSIGEAETSGECGEDAVWSFDKDTKTLTISGSGDMDGYWDYYDQPWYAFSDLIEKVIISDGITNIGDGAFLDCLSLNDITLSDSITGIGYYAFENCTALTEFIIPDSVTRIENEAFYNCPLMTSITVPASVTYIGYQAFGYYYDEEEWQESKVDGFTVNGYSYSAANQYATENEFAFVSLGEIDFSGKCGEDAVWSFDKDTKTLTISGSGDMDGYWDYDQPWDAFSDLIETVVISDGVTGIGDCAFCDCYSLTGITVSDSVIYIGEFAFCGCSLLTDITVPDSVVNIGYYAFEDTAYYNDDANWQDGVLYIGHHLINANISVGDTYTIKSGTVTVADSAFFGCEDLTDINIPDSVVSIGNGAFYNCLMMTSITVPTSVTYIGDMAFGYYYDEEEWEDRKVDGFTVKGYAGTAAEQYAEDNGFTFANIGNCTHSWGIGKITRPATEKETGIKTYTCSLCDATKTEVIAKLQNPAKVFNDIKTKDWYYSAVNYAYNSGLFGGVSPKYFAPNDNMTRGMFVTVLGRLYGVKVNNNITTKFVDVKKGQWYTGYVKWASDAGIVGGVSKTKFAPNANVTREQICKMMVEFCNYAKITLKKLQTPVTFADASKISSWAKSYVKQCQTAGLVGGSVRGGKTYFDPQGNATRAQVAQILYNFSKNYL